MKTSEKGLDLIKKYEGLRLTAYKAVPSEEFYTIGYGHYGKDVSPGMTITKEQADTYLKSDVKKAENAVNNLKKGFNQNQFDALVSFTYNVGVGNLKKLANGRSVEEIGNKITLYNKAGGKTLTGLVRRRNDEQKLYKTPIDNASEIQNGNKEKQTENKPNKTDNEKPNDFKVKISVPNLNIRKGPGTDFEKTGKFTGIGIFTIVDKKDGKGSKKGWGKLKSGAGWISLQYCEVIK